MLIYLADLSYDTIETNQVVPLNIGFLAAYIKENNDSSIQIKLFKSPSKLEKAIRQKAPDILGLSHYGWNEQLNKVFFSLAKELNPNSFTVIGGPNIRHKPEEIEEFLLANKNIDYCILFEGEITFNKLVKEVLTHNKVLNVPDGCATLLDSKIHYQPYAYKSKSSALELPSPYLSGLLDEFIEDSSMIPLFESNRGCPYGCTYCAWGVSALSQIKQRPLEIVLEELDYVAQKSAGQVNWIFADANFGIFDRDIEIAKKIRSIKDNKGFPISVVLWHSKNTSERNIEISKILDDKKGYIARQSTDSTVLKKAGRGKIQMSHLQKQIEHFKEQNMDVTTDVLIGLPGETKQSQRQTLHDAFELGFSFINSYNIRMLQGTDYDSQEHRTEFGIQTKYRPIYGGYGVYNNTIVFEIEESVRATNSMSEEELEEFKIIHWLIYFAWNMGVFKPLLKYGLYHNINPLNIFTQLLQTNNSELKSIFSKMHQNSSEEWFNSKEEMVSYYEKEQNYQDLSNNFVKLNFLWIATFLQDANKFALLKNELTSLLKLELTNNSIDHNKLNKIIEINDMLINTDLLKEPFEKRIFINSDLLQYFIVNQYTATSKPIEVKVFRAQKDVAFCQFHIKDPNLDVKKMTKFLEIGGINFIKNKIDIASKE